MTEFQRGECLGRAARCDILLLPVVGDGLVADAAGDILRAHGIAERFLGRDDADGVERARLFRTHAVGVEPRRRLHGDERQQLKEMVRHHVAQRAGRVVEGAAPADGDGLGDGDLHMVDMLALPDRLEQAVGETQHQNVLHRLLAEIMVDAENLVLVEHLAQFGIELHRRGEVGGRTAFRR